MLLIGLTPLAHQMLKISVEEGEAMRGDKILGEEQTFVVDRTVDIETKGHSFRRMTLGSFRINIVLIKICLTLKVDPMTQQKMKGKI